MNSIKFGNKTIGDDCQAFIIAEIGSNHNNDLATAKELIESAAKAKVDAVKFQTFHANKHYSRFTPSFSYLAKNGSPTSTYDLIKSVELNRSWQAELAEYANKLGLIFMTSPCDKSAVIELAKLPVPVYKVASFDLPDTDLIQFIAEQKKPLILSTGMATYTDIFNAVNVCKAVGNEQIVLLQCTSLYPAPTELANLRAMATLKKAFGFLVGYSDHTIGDHIAIASVALGASVVEKHFTLNRAQQGPDHPFAIEPNELSAMVEKIRAVEKSLGNGFKFGPSTEELEMFEKGRRSIHTTRYIKAGDILTREDLCIKRPGYGINPNFLEKIIGMKITLDIPEDYWITWENFKTNTKENNEKSNNFANRGGGLSATVSN